MNLIANMFSFLKSVLTSRIGHLLLVLNVCLIVLFYSQITSKFYHSDGTCVTVIELKNSAVLYDLQTPLWLVIWTIINLPALLCASLFSMPFEKLFPAMCAQTSSIIQFIVLIVFSSIQWQFIGYVLEKVTIMLFGNKKLI